MRFWSKLFGGSNEEAWEPSEETTTEYIEEDDGSVTEATLLSERDGIDFFQWASEHREEAFLMLGGKPEDFNPEPEEEQPRGFWGKLFGS